MLVAGISFITSCCFFLVCACVLFFLLIKRKNRIAYNNKIRREKKALEKQIQDLIEGIDTIESIPKPSKDDIEKGIEQETVDAGKSNVGKVGELKFRDVKDAHGKLSELSKIVWDKIGTGVFTYGDNKQSNKAFYLKNQDNGKCLKFDSNEKMLLKLDKLKAAHAYETPCPDTDSNGYPIFAPDKSNIGTSISVFEVRDNGVYWLNPPDLNIDGTVTKIPPFGPIYYSSRLAPFGDGSARGFFTAPK